MQSLIILALVIAVVLRPSGGETTNIVHNRVIMEIQPEAYNLGDYFSEAANQVLIDSSYTFLQSREGEGLGDVTMEEIGYYLETGGYGILEYGGHGNDDGETSGETFATYEQAVSKKNYLIEWLYFAAEDLVVLPRGSYYSLGLTPVYTNNMPSECSVAFISTCYSNVAGDFNASCKVAGTGAATNVQLMESFNCLISWLEDPNYRTIDQAAAQCYSTNPNWVFTVTNGNWQLFDFGNPAATVYGFSVSGGIARWRVTSQYETDSYVVEGAPNPGGPWQEITVEPPTVGDHAVAVVPYAYYRFVEIEKDGGKLVHGLAVDSPPTSRVVAEPPSLEELHAIIEGRKADLLASLKPEKHTHTTDTLLIVTTDALAGECANGIAGYWSLHGAAVSLLTVDGFEPDPNMRRTQIHAAIMDSINDGVNCVLFVGDANDYVQFDMSEEGPEWWPVSWQDIHDHYLIIGFPSCGQPDHDLIPAWYEPDTLPRRQNTAFTLPYIPYLGRYADVDGDDIPDVPWGCLPFMTEEQVAGYACKLWLISPSDSGAADVAFYVCDRDYEYAGDGAIARAAAGAVETALPSWVERHHLYVTDVPGNDERNTAAADLWNGSNAGIHVLMGSLSTRYKPADFFDKACGWHMGMLTPYMNYYPLVVANSCSGGDWARTEDPQLDAPVLEDFLAAYDRGALAWIGPSVGTWQHANKLFGEYLIEELYADPSRSMAASFLAAQRRMLEDPELDAATKLVARMMCFFGDPLAPLNELAAVVAVDRHELPPPFALEQNVPNPFNPTTTIRYSIPVPGRVRLKIYDAAGRLVRTLVDEEQSPRAGVFRVNWNGTNDAGREVASGVYFCRLTMKGYSQTKKMVILR